MNSGQLPGLYIHIPFCRSKCRYCDFYSVASLSALPAWLEAVRAEMGLYRDRFREFDSLYLGGGTPTVLGERELAGLLECARESFVFRPGSEMTMEANPDGLSADKLKTVRDLGINRLSLGVQSLDDAVLQYLGRTHNAKQALDALEAARAAGFANIGVDLIYGMEPLSLGTWNQTMDRILAFGPEHISCYQMTLAKGTALWKMKEAGRVRPIGEKMESAFFIRTSRHLERHGYLHYEVSNFAAGREFLCRHNRKYWSHVPYLGLGPSAHSFQAASRWWNVRSVDKYCRLLAEGKAPVESSEILSQEQLALEKLSLGLRTSEGADLDAPEASSKKGGVLAELQRAGLVRIRDGKIQPTRKGLLVADSLPLMICD